jgi:hypothetical protein
LADTPGALGYYLGVPVEPAGRPNANAKQCIEVLNRAMADGRRTWYVCHFGREDPPAEADRWFWSNAIRMLRINRKHFDYTQHALDVYLFNATAADRERIEREKP